MPIADTIAELFYRRLFQIDPATRELFRATDMFAQRKKSRRPWASPSAASTISTSFLSTVEDLGRRHARYGVTDKHYDYVGAALLWTLEQGLGRADARGGIGLAEVYGLLSAVMRGAAEQEAMVPQGASA